MLHLGGYTFDGIFRSVVDVIIGGDKTGRNHGDFYAQMTARSERIWREYLAEQERGEHDEE